MNEKIKELYNRAFSEYFGEECNEWIDILPEEQYFAELIVKECIKTIIEYDLVPGHSGKWEDIYEIHARLLQDLGEELKEHFGIE